MRTRRASLPLPLSSVVRRHVDTRLTDCLVASPFVHFGLRLLAGVAAGTLLLVPAILTLIAWTSLNLVISVAAVLLTVSLAQWLPRWKWFGGFVTALLVAIPPYPYWVYASETRGWYMHFFSGFDSSTLPLATFGAVFFVALILCGTLFWALDPSGTLRHDA